jgi:hypothetical protein
VSPGEELERSEIEAVLETRRELGLRYDAELVDGFADRIEAEVTRRVGEQLELQQRRVAALSGGGQRQLALGIITLVAFIPISIVLGVNGEFIALLVTIAGLVGVNLAHAWQSRRP